MWLEFCQQYHRIRQHGFLEQTVGDKVFYSNRPLVALSDIRDAQHLEYAQIIEYHVTHKQLAFARDYLGHHPLLYTQHGTLLLIADNLSDILRWRRAHNAPIQLNEFALALYFSMGYVPQGLSLFEHVTLCENAMVYRAHPEGIRTESLFRAIEIRPEQTTDALYETILQQTQRYTQDAKQIDVWCSGGLDSSIVAYCAQQHRHDDTQLLSFDYPDSVPSTYRTGELPFVRHVADAYHLPLRLTQLSHEGYHQALQDFLRSFPMPVIDICVPPKYLLAKATQGLALTGEGGDPLFSGVKNNFMLYTEQHMPNTSLGWRYALSHKRFALQIDPLFTRGLALTDRIGAYFDDLFDRYPGSIITKLLYMNTFVKQGGLIFLENYYAEQCYGVQIRHPLTSLSTYQTAFELKDALRYQYPQGKLALKSAFGHALPPRILNRKKSGTLVPMQYYIETTQPTLHPMLLDTGCFNLDALERITEHAPLLFHYALTVLNQWLSAQLGELHHDATALSTDPSCDVLSNVDGTL